MSTWTTSTRYPLQFTRHNALLDASEVVCAPMLVLISAYLSTHVSPEDTSIQLNPRILLAKALQANGRDLQGYKGQNGSRKHTSATGSNSFG